MVKSTEKFLYKFPFFSCFAKNGSKMRLVRSLCVFSNTSVGVPCLNDGAAVHEHDMIGHIAGKRHLVGDDDHGGVLALPVSG